MRKNPKDNHCRRLTIIRKDKQMARSRIRRSKTEYQKKVRKNGAARYHVLEPTSRDGGGGGRPETLKQTSTRQGGRLCKKTIYTSSRRGFLNIKPYKYYYLFFRLIFILL